MTEDKSIFTVDEETAALYTGYWNAAMEELKEGIIDADEIPVPKDYWFLCNAMLSIVEEDYDLEWDEDETMERCDLVNKMAWVLMNFVKFDYGEGEEEDDGMKEKLEDDLK